MKKILTVLLALLATLVLASPAQAAQSYLYIDNSAVSGWGLTYAAADWSASPYVEVRLTSTCEGKARCVTAIDGGNELGNDVVAAYLPGYGEIWFNRNYNSYASKFKRQSACHEIGHVLGLGHVEKGCMRAVVYVGGPYYVSPSAWSLENAR